MVKTAYRILKKICILSKNSKYHELKGNRAEEWSISVSKNWRIVFKFIDGDAYVVNYEDYH